ncbi:hypothetical protein TWF694_005158 [Orbilia ellipsospora]|uniref:Uncharacterized protein n=1 Tax=Orbilia ellipsospora TaxID=2528407 RepID=A0AAV9WW13_9PEZI
MLFAGRPNQSRVLALAAIILLIVWLYKVGGDLAFAPSITKGPWNQKIVGIAASTATEISKPATPKIQDSSTGTQSKESSSTTTAGNGKPVRFHNKTIIIGKMMREDTTWVQKNFASSWRAMIYAVDDIDTQEYQHVLVNKGRESMPYLTYLIDYYDDLSDINVFLHAHEDDYPRAWHNEPPSANYSAVKMLNLLRLDNVREQGYVNLRCNRVPGCPGELHPNRTSFNEEAIEPTWKMLWEYAYGNTFYPDTVGVACCAQFAVTRDKVRERPKGFYQKLMNWLLTTEADDPGRAFEYFWHIIFGMPLVHCEGDYQACICRTYDCGTH